MELSKRRAVIAMLAMPTYSIIKAFCHHKLHYDFMAETDIYANAVCAAFGLVPKKETV